MKAVKENKINNANSSSIDTRTPLLKQIEERIEPIIEKIADEKKNTLRGNFGITIFMNMLEYYLKLII